MDVNERALAGLFLAFQYPVEIPGVTVGKYLKRIKELRLPDDTKLNVTQFIKSLRQEMDFLKMDQNFINRYLNEGFSGGEKKRNEIRAKETGLIRIDTKEIWKEVLQELYHSNMEKKND